MRIDDANSDIEFVETDQDPTIQQRGSIRLPTQPTIIMLSEYTAQILKLRLPEQDELKNESERCSADPVMLESIGRALGQQVRVKRSDGSGFVALYTVNRPIRKPT